METERGDGVGSRGEPVPCAGVSIILNCQEQQRWRENFLDKKWVQINEAVASAKLVRCSKTTDPRQVSIILYMRSDVSGSTTPGGGERES